MQTNNRKSARLAKPPYKANTVVPYGNDDSKWCCLCVSGPEQFYDQKGKEILSCNNCGSWGHFRCYGLDEIKDDKKAVEEYFHLCAHCAQLETNLIRLPRAKVICNDKEEADSDGGDANTVPLNEEPPSVSTHSVLQQSPNKATQSRKPIDIPSQHQTLSGLSYFSI